ncbi:MAG: twin-arginine translocation signal domain-containing protein [Myxococcales bacterium]|nr:twin-arginine translocation signal domain-containing protein [Myxococcales bacterium]
MPPWTRRGLLSRALALGACGLAAGLAPSPAWARPKASRFRDLEPFTSNELEARADALAQAIGIDVAKRQDVARRLRKTLWSARFQELLERPGITGVAAYRGGGGGLLVRHARTRGLVFFHHMEETGEPAIPFDLNITTFGAHIGGSGDWGVLLIAGLREAAGFGGQYRAKLTAATAAEKSSVTATMYRHNIVEARHVHDVYFVGAAEGLSADAGGGVVKITVRPDERAAPSDDAVEASAEFKVSAKPSHRGG